MNIKYLIIGLMLLSIYPLCGQNTQHFTKRFKTEKGLYGLVYFTTKTDTLLGEPYVWVEQNKVIAKGIVFEKQELNNSELNKLGLTFPLVCTDCSVTISGIASHAEPSRWHKSNASFKSVKKIKTGEHNMELCTVDFTYNYYASNEVFNIKWLETGLIEQVSINSINGFNDLNNTLDQYIYEKQRLKKYTEYMRRANNAFTDNQKLQLLLQAWQYTANVTEVDIEIQKCRKRIKNAAEQEEYRREHLREKESMIVVNNETDIKDSSDRKLQIIKNKISASTAVTAAGVAKNTERLGLGLSGTYGEISTIGPEGYFLFGDHLGVSFYYGFAPRDDNFTGNEVGGGIVFDFNAKGKMYFRDGFGMGLNLLYSTFERKENNGDIVQGSYTSMGIVGYLGFVKIGFSSPVVQDIKINGRPTSIFGPGTLHFGIFTYF